MLSEMRASYRVRRYPKLAIQSNLVILTNSILTKTNKEVERWKGHTTAKKQDLELERTAQPFRASMRHFKLGENSCVN